MVDPGFSVGGGDMPTCNVGAFRQIKMIEYAPVVGGRGWQHPHGSSYDL